MLLQELHCLRYEPAERQVAIVGQGRVVFKGRGEPVEIAGADRSAAPPETINPGPPGTHEPQGAWPVDVYVGCRMRLRRERSNRLVHLDMYIDEDRVLDVDHGHGPGIARPLLGFLHDGLHASRTAPLPGRFDLHTTPRTPHAIESRPPTHGIDQPSTEFDRMQWTGAQGAVNSFMVGLPTR